MSKRKYYVITEDKLRQLIRCRVELEALEAGGVDNWSWYSDSFSDYLNDYFGEERMQEEDLGIDDVVDEQIIKFEEV